MEAAPINQRLRLWADELRAISNEGLHWASDDPYNARRWNRLIRSAAEVFAAQDSRDASEVEWRAPRV